MDLIANRRSTPVEGAQLRFNLFGGRNSVRVKPSRGLGVRRSWLRQTEEYRDRRKALSVLDTLCAPEARASIAVSAMAIFTCS